MSCGKYEKIDRKAKWCLYPDYGISYHLPRCGLDMPEGGPFFRIPNLQCLHNFFEILNTNPTYLALSFLCFALAQVKTPSILNQFDKFSKGIFHWYAKKSHNILFA